MKTEKVKTRQRTRRRRHVRRKVSGTPERARLSVFRSGKHIYCQVVDDAAGRTLAAASTLDADLQGALAKSSNVDAARQVGELIAKRATAAGIEKVVFDRGGFKYHGRVKALADGARAGGLKF